MLVLPMAAFLAGALLSLLVPALLLTALIVWYWAFVARVPGPADPAETPANDPPETSPPSSG